MAFQILRVFLAGVPSVVGHAWLKEPSSRNAEGKGYSCPHCGQGDGPNNVKKRNAMWPTHHGYGGHGLCGDPFQGEPTTSYEDEHFLQAVESAPVATYSAGQMVKFEVYISTHHNGHFSYRLCDKVISPSTFANAKEGQDCLDQHLLERVPPELHPDGACAGGNKDDVDCQPMDSKHPDRWYLPPRGGSANTMSMWYYLPPDVTCEKCTLQWYWSTGNTCLYDEDYCDYFGKGGDFEQGGWSDATSWNSFASQSWGRNQVCGGATFAEEFWNCADIRIAAGDGSSRPPSTPRPNPVPQPVAPRPAPFGGDDGGGAGGGLAKQCRSKCGVRAGDWKSDFTEFEGNNNFCNCGFGGSCGFICGGGMDGSSGGQCPKETCDDQYKFKDNTWTIHVDKSVAAKKVPYRAFAYVPFPKTTPDYTFAFSFRTRGMEGWGAYVKLLFWTDAGNVIGLLPKNSVKGKQSGNQKLKLITFMQDDYPNDWGDEVEVQDNTWYSVKVRFQGKKVTVEVTGAGVVFQSSVSDFPFDGSGPAGNGPQVGVYHFDFDQNAQYDADRLWLDLAAFSGPEGNVDRHDCEHGCLVEAEDGYGAEPESEPESEPEPDPTQPTPAPSPGPAKQCAQWCDRPPVPWTEKCSWSYCGACSSCRTPPPPPTRPPPPPPPPPPPAPTGDTYCCTYSLTKSCGDCDEHNRMGTDNWCTKSEANCAGCNGIFCLR